MKYLIAILFSSFFCGGKAQTFISKKNASDTTLIILKKYNLKSVGFFSHQEYNKSTNEFNLFLAQDKKSKKWGIMTSMKSWNSSEHEYIIKPEFDSIGDFSLDKPIVILKKGDKYGVIFLDWKRSKIKPVVHYDEVVISDHISEDYVFVRKGKQWGLFQTQYDMLSVPCMYNRIDEVPQYSFTNYDYKLFMDGKKSKGFTGFRPDGNGDGVYYACGTDRKWGLFQMDKQIIPMKYDKIEPMSWNSPFIIVYNKSKAGVYINPFSTPKMTIPCQYDELKRFKHGGYFGCAVRRGNKWGIIDWYTGKMITSFTFESFDSIIVPLHGKSTFYK